MKKTISFVLRHLVLLFLSVVWLIPILWLFVTSFSGYKGINTSHFFPETWTLDNYAQLFLRSDSIVQYNRWFLNTFIIAAFSCLISTILVLMVAYTMSKLRFAGRKGLMSFAIILNMFPGVLSMIAIYFILKTMGLTNSHLGMIIVYSAGAGLGYLICKGFMDTISISLSEAARLEGASEAKIFWKIIIPLSKPIIVYTVINAFLAPWADFVFAKLMLNSGVATDWTVAIGLFNMLGKSMINKYFSVFCAGGVIIAIPISVLFVIMQKFYVEGITGGSVKG